MFFLSIHRTKNLFISVYAVEHFPKEISFVSAFQTLGWENWTIGCFDKYMNYFRSLDPGLK